MDQTISHLEGILAVRVFYDLVRDILLERGKPVLVKEFPSLLEKKGFRLPKRLVRYLLSLWDEGIIEDGFVDLSHRKEPSNRPLEGDIERLLRKAGKPISLGILSQELATVQRRVAEIYKQSLPSFISTRPKKYFLLNELVGLREWLLQVEEGATDDDVLFFNFHPEELSLLKQW
ncbi:MAG: hypothetical protein H5T69_21020, partial [Chloroflexi bacterium]|nr:hypothetical protein [Chloroflexota bacterium]